MEKVESCSSSDPKLGKEAYSYFPWGFGEPAAHRLELSRKMLKKNKNALGKFPTPTPWGSPL